jgi:shikimate dehydrogenase
MFPHDEDCPLPADLSLSDFKGLCGVFDAVYHPLRTELVLAAKALKIPATGGLAMLVAQAAAATQRFLECSVSDEVIHKITNTLNAQKQNIVLIGMPACGKTTVGQLLSQTLGRELIDTDEEITRAVGMTPGDYITKYGEEAFRKVESKVIRDKIAPMSGVIVATGGGAVLDAQNVRRLKRNGALYFLDRPLHSLQATNDRPLSADPELLRRRYEERYDVYCSAADVRLPVDENETPDATARRILTMAQEV